MPGTKSEPLLQITDGALREVAGLAARGNGGRLALWIEITGVGADDFSYNLSLRPLAEAGTEDLVEEHGEVVVVVPAANIDQLRGATVDLVGDLSTGGLIVENPNTPSPAVSDFPELELAGTVEERVSHVLNQQINPSIALHGGRAALVEVREKTAYLQMSGGCQGCGLAAVTLKRGIEAAIKQSVPEITDVVDVTDHAAGLNPYYDPESV
jgi:Fe/S biogenesis protein NfuA